MPRSFVALVCFFIALSPALSQEAPKENCEQIVENFCDALWAPEHLGNYDLKLGSTIQKIRLGRTKNDIDHRLYSFFETLRKRRTSLPKDIRQALDRNGFFQTLDRYLKRKPRSKVTLSDLSKEEWTRNPSSRLEEIMVEVAQIRTEKTYPGFIRLANRETSSELKYQWKINLDLAWSELFVSIWSKDERWLGIKTVFNELRNEYESWIRETPHFTENQKNQFLSSLGKLQLKIPGESPTRANVSDGHYCGLNERNAYYSVSRHEITVCAGNFMDKLALLTLAHEMGHAIGIQRRMLEYFFSTSYGEMLVSLWNRSQKGEHFTCSDWEKYKTDFIGSVAAIKPYVYEDAAHLEKFVRNPIDSMPDDAGFDRTADRLTKSVVRYEVNSSSIEGLLKKEEILPTGVKKPNFKYLKPPLNTTWPNPLNSLDSVYWQFELFFAESYSCQIEKKASETVALKNAIEESKALALLSMRMLLEVPGRYSYLQSARDEGFARDIEEDVADSYASTAVARYLSRFEKTEERRALFLSSVSGHCTEPSFLQRYPDEALVLRSYSNQPHSVGLDRRKKFLTPEIRAALVCE